MWPSSAVWRAPGRAARSSLNPIPYTTAPSQTYQDPSFVATSPAVWRGHGRAARFSLDPIPYTHSSFPNLPTPQLCGHQSCCMARTWQGGQVQLGQRVRHAQQRLVRGHRRRRHVQRPLQLRTPAQPVTGTEVAGINRVPAAGNLVDTASAPPCRHPTAGMRRQCCHQPALTAARASNCKTDPLSAKHMP